MNALKPRIMNLPDVGYDVIRQAEKLDARRAELENALLALDADAARFIDSLDEWSQAELMAAGVRGPR